MTRTPVRSLLASLVLLAGLAACGSDDDGGAVASDSSGDATETTAAPEAGGSEAAGTDQVAIADFKFDPVDITVPVGTTVTWTNEDDAVHSVADSTLDFESDDMDKGDTFEFTYEEAGEYPYVCGIHNYMKGTVTVE